MVSSQFPGGFDGHTRFAGLIWRDGGAVTESLVTSALADLAAAGAAADSARRARDALLPASAGPAFILGTGQPAAPRDAALLNGISAHSLELDDTHEPSSSHPGTVIWSALLAAGALATTGPPPTMAALLASAVVGYQVMASLGELLGPAELYRQGVHPTAICGVFGAAAAVGRLMALDAEGIRRAFGIALSMSAGSMAYLSDGAWTKRLHSGSAAAGGILAVQLAAGGFTGPRAAFDDRSGLMHIYGGIRPRAHAEAVLRRAAGLAAVHETSVKFHPCCRYMHGVMDLLAGYRTGGGRVEGLERIDCGVLSGGMSLVGEPLARKKAVTNMVDAAYPARWGADVALSFADGEVVTLHTGAFRGSPGWPAGRAEIAGKAAELLGEPTAHRILTALDALGDGQPADLAAAAGAAMAATGTGRTSDHAHR
jgi:2-methylcitrate dehydratase PrpD